MKKLKRLFAAVLSLTVSATMFGCTPTIGNNTKYAATIDGYDVKSGIFIYYTMQAYNEAYSLLSEDSEETLSMNDIKNSYIDGLEAVDWIQDKATEYCEGFVNIQKEFENAGLELSEEELDEIKESAEYYYNQDDTYVTNGISEDSIKDLIANSYKEQAVFKYYYGFDGSKGGTEEELKDYFDENFARVKYFTISLTDDEGELMSEDEQRNLRKMAESYVKRINEQETDEEKFLEFNEVYDEYNEYLDSLTATDEDSESEDEDSDVSTVEQLIIDDNDEDTEDTTEDEEETTDEEDSDNEEETEEESDEESTETTATTADDEDSEEVTTTTTAVEETDEDEETTTTDPHANERLYQKQTTTSADENDSTETTTTESESSVNSRNFSDFIFSDLGMYKAQVYDYDDETIYVIIRGDLRERMTEDDYWSEDYIESLLELRYFDEFIEYMEGVTDTLSLQKNNSSYRRYSPFKLDIE